jgi:hypothetical protein
MIRPIVLAIVLSFSSISPFIFTQAARSQVVLTRATIAALRNQVRFVARNQAARAARVADVMTPGDAIATAANSQADLRFNDNSLARLGAQTVFRFAAGTRTVDLTRGTALMLIQPGSGGTTLRTPNGAAGIRGSAIFCRYNPQTDTTLFGALTDSGIEVFNRDGTQRLELKGGQMAVLVEGRIDRVYNIDLNSFYETSSLVEGLDLTNPSAEGDKRLNPVRSEVSEALAEQSPLNAATTIVNPEFARLPQQDEEFGDPTVSTVDFDFNDYLNRDRNAITTDITAVERDRNNVRSLLTGGQIQALPSSPAGLNPTSGSGNPFPNSNPLNTGGGGNIGGSTGGNPSGGGGFNNLGTVFPNPAPNTNNTGNGNPGGGNTGGNFPGGGNTGGNFPGGGNTGGNFPGGGATGGNFPGQGNGVN